jgi:hypothetical protein|tara:strand:+ start:153 stop:881 length:729 start_codon:yes stop_codon:yes gene_type:complete
MISKGIFGIGCSYMWGEGLYYYSNLPDLPEKGLHHYFDEENILDTHNAFKNKHRFIQLVSDHYNVWNWTFGNGFNMNGGSNIRSFNDLMFMFNEEYKLTPNHFSLFIYQFTAPTRDQIDGSGGGGEYYPIEQQIQSVYDNMKRFIDSNVKIVTINWYKEIANHPLYKKLFSDFHCDIEVDGVIKESFDYFVEDDKYKCSLRSDFYPPYLENDTHLNIKGHRCVADSIIKKLEKDKFNPKDYE